MQKLRQLSNNPQTRDRLFIEIGELPCNVSLTRVTEAIAQVKGFVRRATVRLPAVCATCEDWTKIGADGLVLPLEGHLPESYIRQQIKFLNGQARRASAFSGVDGIGSADVAALAYALGVREVCGDHITHAYGNRCEASPLAAHDVIHAAQAA